MYLGPLLRWLKISLLPSELLWDKCPHLTRGQHQEGEGVWPVPPARGVGNESRMPGYLASGPGMRPSPFWAGGLRVLSLQHSLIFYNNHTLHL